MDRDDGHPKRPVAPHIKYKSAAISAGQSSSKTPEGIPSDDSQHKDTELTSTQMSRLEALEKENEAQKTALAKLEKENEAQKQALSESQTELQAWKDFHAEGPTSSLSGENVHDLLHVKALMREDAIRTGNTGRKFQDEIDRLSRGAVNQCDHLPPWINSAGEFVGEPLRVTYQDKFGKPGVLGCEDRRGGFCRNDWPSMFHCLKCDTYFCRPCGSAHNFRPKWIVRLEEEYEATHER
ncbi:hypothetical protein KCU98_g3283, partial [Aureobasidium melanogenum]